MGYDTALNLVNDAAGLAGLGAPVSDLYGSRDSNYIQLQVMLKDLGQELVTRRQWTQLQRWYLFQTNAGQSRYPRPVDYQRFIDQSAWNKSTRLPMATLSPQQYQFYKSMLVGVVFQTLYRDLQGNFQVYPDQSTPGGFVIVYEYVSTNWVLPVGTQVTSGTWQVATTYPNGSFVEHGGKIYVSITQPAWVTLTPYALGAVVVNGGNVYICTSAGTSGASGPSGTGGTINDGTAVWKFSVASGSGITGLFGPIGFGDGSTKPAWANNTIYTVGSRVTNNNNVYVCMVAGTSALSTDPNGTGPQTQSTNISDGTVTWNFSCTVAQATSTTFIDGSCIWNFVGPSGSDAPTQNGDVILFDKTMIRRGLKYRWKAEKGLATQRMKDEFDDMVNAAKDADSAAPILYLDRGGTRSDFLLSERNIPWTGFSLPPL